MSKLSRGANVTLIDHEAAVYEGKIEKLDADPPSLFLKTYDSSQSRFVSRGFPPEEIRRIQYQTSSPAPAIAGLLIGGTVGGLLGHSYGANSDIEIEDATLGGVVLGGLTGGFVGGLIGGLLGSTQHVIDCPGRP